MGQLLGTLLLDCMPRVRDGIQALNPATRRAHDCGGWHALQPPVSPLALLPGSRAASMLARAASLQTAPRTHSIHHCAYDAWCWCRWGYMTRAGVNDKSQLMRQIEKYAGEAQRGCTGLSLHSTRAGQASEAWKEEQNSRVTCPRPPHAVPYYCLHTLPPDHARRHLHQPCLQLPALHPLRGAAGRGRRGRRRSAVGGSAGWPQKPCSPCPSVILQPGLRTSGPLLPEW